MLWNPSYEALRTSTHTLRSRVFGPCRTRDRRHPSRRRLQAIRYGSPRPRTGVLSQLGRRQAWRHPRKLFQPTSHDGDREQRARRGARARRGIPPSPIEQGVGVAPSGPPAHVAAITAVTRVPAPAPGRVVAAEPAVAALLLVFRVFSRPGATRDAGGGAASARIVPEVRGAGSKSGLEEAPFRPSRCIGNRAARHGQASVAVAL